MSYKIRNSIVIGVFVLLVVVVGGYITLIFQPKQIQRNREETKKITLHPTIQAYILLQLDLIYVMERKFLCHGMTCTVSVK